jgi:CheY-like chemotaxis protein
LNLLNNIDNENNSYLDPSSLSILIVEDNFDILRLMQRGLKEYGFNVSFTDPVRVLEDFKVNCKGCSLIISDIRMPGMNGYEFVMKAKEIDKQIKIVLMSAFEINDDEELHNMLRIVFPIEYYNVTG